ncbi:hypothetical protein [Streptomyces sp. NPDC090445]|uniref:hypothetical protein n=1 Tax=Streptomyces sp. NPDC090445 TaxID=3365963 RepID=UPI00381D40A8
MNSEDAIQHLGLTAQERAFGRHVRSDRLIQAGLDALLAGVESPSLALLAGLTRSEEPEAQELFDRVLEELGLVVEVPGDERAAAWAKAYWLAGRIVDGSLDPAVGTDRIWVETAWDLNRPEELREVVECAQTLAAWDEDRAARGISFDVLKAEAAAAAERFLRTRPRRLP